MSSLTRISIRGYHCDAYGHVNNARYLELFEEARWRMLEEFNFLDVVANRNWQLFIVEIDVKFKKPVKVGDDVTIMTSINQFERKTMTFDQRMVNDTGMVCCVAMVKSVIFNVDSQSVVPFTEEIKAMFDENSLL